MSQSASAGPIVTSVQAKLESLLPTKIRIRNDSKGHASHYESDGSEASTHGETHLALTVVSEQFEGLSRVKRHQLVYSLLSEEFSQGLHALQLSLKTPKEENGGE